MRRSDKNMNIDDDERIYCEMRARGGPRIENDCFAKK